MRCRCAPVGAHPRSRGEHRPPATEYRGPPGSSPLARGTLSFFCWLAAFPGLIPARAGNTRGGSARRRVFWAHPRSRGEHMAPTESTRAKWGSSPLARGTPSTIARVTGAGGLIPARAGNTLPYSPGCTVSWAHPRSRGEHKFAVGAVTSWAGSSPLARGTLAAGGQPVLVGGLIPARAGNTASVRADRQGVGAHPRSRGEHRTRSMNQSHGKGSSPLARGTPRRTHQL